MHLMFAVNVGIFHSKGLCMRIVVSEADINDSDR